MKNELKRKWQAGEGTHACWLLVPSGYTAETMARVGWDALLVDLQHGVQDYQSMVACFQAMQSHPVTRLVRVPSNEPGIIGKALDAGAQGIICPMVNNAAEARALVRAAKYPPAGFRSNGPVRAGMYVYGSTSYQESANDEQLVIAMIETKQGVDNIDDILAVKGIDSIYVGPTDLGFSMGLPPVLDREEQQILDIYAYLIARCRAAGVVAGIHVASPAYAKRMIELGFLWTSIGADSAFMATAATNALAEVRGT
ncbi:HpcH/HpaI aldolase/citrate lyase family protein [Rhizobiaceae sp. 2RAB30]